MKTFVLALALVALPCAARQPQQPASPHSSSTSQVQSTNHASSPDSEDPKPDELGVYRTGHGIVPPKPIALVDAQIAPQAAIYHLDGKCVIELIVETDGKVKRARILHSLSESYGDRKLKAAALEQDNNALIAVGRDRFKPATLHGKPVPVYLTVETFFHSR
jgi:outer membrane biosynthesis protein TonB